MCGINGIFSYAASASSPSEAELVATRDHMRTRGPDGAGAWWSADRRCALGHRRLSIIDLSDRAAQPMTNEAGDLVVTFNGEIYNYPELKSELEAQGVRFRTNSDTEVLLHLYAREGAKMAARLRGMFAFAIWDQAKQGLFIARDPYGIKPLYVSDEGGVFRFASQVKAILAGGGVSRDLDPAGVVGFHLMGSVPEPFTSFRAVRALPAGHSLWVDADGVRTPASYVSISAILATGAAKAANDGEIDERVRTAVLDSVRAHLLADVEVGAFLSAGVDSGALLGLMRDAGQQHIRAITLGFDEFRGTEEDEGPLAAQVASHYGATHHVRHVGEDEFKADLPEIFEAMDQPSIDGVNTWFVSKAAREAGLKVAISGLGGDELLAGYASFRDIPRWVKWLRVPGMMPGLGIASRQIGQAVPGLSARKPKALGMIEYGTTYPGAYLLRRGVLMPFELDAILDPGFVAEGLRRLEPLKLIGSALIPDPGSTVGRVASLEAQNYMRNQLLRDADWAGMAHSLEIRTPLVDIELLRALSPVLPKLEGSRGKQALAAAPTLPLPARILNRRKTGFGVPDRPLARRRGAYTSRRGQGRRIPRLGA